MWSSRQLLSPGEVYVWRAPSAKTLILGRLGVGGHWRDDHTQTERRRRPACLQTAAMCAVPVMTRGPIALSLPGRETAEDGSVSKDTVRLPGIYFVGFRTNVVQRCLFPSVSHKQTICEQWSMRFISSDWWILITLVSSLCHSQVYGVIHWSCINYILS